MCGTDHQGSAPLRCLWSFLLSSSPQKAFVLSHRVGSIPLFAEGARGQVNNLPRVIRHSGGVGTHVIPKLSCFSSSANLCLLSGGSRGQEVTEFPSLSFFPPVFFQSHYHSMRFSSAVSTSWGFHLPRLWHPSLLSCPLPHWPSFPVYLMKALESLGPSCPPAQ